MGRLFGTDGIRGVANKELDAVLAFHVGQAAAAVLAKAKKGRPVFTIGKDTRISSDMLEAALTSGLCSAGADVIPLGVVPTPAVAYITVSAGADAGIVISASHNPYEYNGIKIFDSQGFKLSEALENEIEDFILSAEEPPRVKNEDIGRVINEGSRLADAYINHVAGCAEGGIRGLRAVIDCANGASSTTARQLFSHFPMEFEIINDQPNGININNNCGSTHMDGLSKAVIEGGFDLGIAFDGDADRCLIVDEKGNKLDGDNIMAICALGMKKRGKLKNDTVVATIMSGLGFHKYANDNDFKVLCADVGDKYVLRMMQEKDCNLGGEQSGHMIFLDDSTTGDGQLTAVKFLSILSDSGKKVSELVAEIPQYPQIHKNVPIEGGNQIKDKVMQSEELKTEIRAVEVMLGGSGRVLIRPSGTEALIRVMVEANDMSVAINSTEKLSNTIKYIIKGVIC